MTNGVPALMERDNNGNDSDSEQSVVHCALLHPVHRRISGCVLNNVNTYPPLTYTFLKWPFLTDFKKYTHTPPTERNFGTSDQTFKNHGKNAKTHRVGTS